MTSLKDLNAFGGFVPDKPVKKEIKFNIGGKDYEATIHVKQLSIGEYENVFLTDVDRKSQTAKTIAEAIFLGDDAKERITFKDAYRLNPALAAAMLTAFHEVNTPKKSSRAATGSSAS